MRFGPIVWRELIVTARQRSTYVGRALSALTFLIVIFAFDTAARQLEWDRGTVGGQQRFALMVFGTFAGFSVLIAMMVPPGTLAPSIARERDAKSLDALLTTPLSDPELVTGKLAAGLVDSAESTLAAVPVAAVLVFGWGVDPRLAVLTYAAVAATAFLCGALGLWVSARSRNQKRAAGFAVLFMMLWAYMPFLTVTLLPKLWPGLSRWVAPLAAKLIETSPVGLLANVAGIIRRTTLLDATLRMIAWELLIGAVLLGWTAWRFRALCRAVEDREGRRWLRRISKMVAPRRPACGDDPVLWYEMYNTRGAGPLLRRVGQVFGACLYLGLAALIVSYAVPAFVELYVHGYGAAADSSRPDYHPLIRGLVGLRQPVFGVPPGTARLDFNGVIRTVSSILLLIMPIVVSGFAVEGLTLERSRDTLSGLLATPLTGPEILRAKMLGAVYRVRGLLICLLAMWTLGLLAGAIHPAGYLAGVVGLAVSIWFCVALGTYGSLWSADLKEANNRVTLPMTFLTFTVMLPIMLPSRFTSVLFGTLSPSWLCYLSLAAFEDLREVLKGQTYPPLMTVGLATGEGIGAVVATCILGWGVQGVAAAWLTWSALQDFDRAVGRPVRPPQPPLAAREGFGPGLVVTADAGC
jgi:ABC-type Na+ efflux pump permease subunit